MKEFDLWIIDIDGTVAPHLTVGLANKIYLTHLFSLFGRQYKFDRILTTKDSIILIIKFLFRKLKTTRIKCKIKPGRLILLTLYGLSLYIIKFISDIKGSLTGYVNNGLVVKAFVSMIKRNRINPCSYKFSESELNNSLYPGIKDFLKNKKVVGISQSFSFGGGVEIYSSLLRLKELHSNEFTNLKIINSSDKKNIAEEMIRKYNAKSVAVIANDYIDKSMMCLADFTIVNKAPRKIRKIADISIDENYTKLSF